MVIVSTMYHFKMKSMVLHHFEHQIQYILIGFKYTWVDSQN